MATEPLLMARGLVKRYGRVTALDHADFDLYPGEILAVIGDNGAGKSSLIKAISGAVRPDEGEIRLEGQPIHFSSPIEARKAGIETVYQNLALSPALSIADNMFLGREIRKPGFMGKVMRKLDHSAMEKMARQKLTELGLMTIQNINQAVETLSGGQRQGVAVARAAAFGSKVIILDEPTAALGVGKPSRAGTHPRRPLARHPDRADLAQHAACLRGGGSHPHPPPRASLDGDQSEGIHNVGRRRLHDRRQVCSYGACCRMTMTIEDIAGEVLARAGDAKRFLIAIAGPPGAGKSTMADHIADALRAGGETAAVLPMDGFHMDNAILIERGQLARKGIPETFDVRGFLDIIRAVRLADQEVLVPVFDRSRELAIASARPIGPEHRFIIVEGNYLLFSLGKWAELEGVFDYSIMLAPPIEVLEERLWARWRGYKLSEEESARKVYENDLPNGRLILGNRRRADVTLEIA